MGERVVEIDRETEKEYRKESEREYSSTYIWLKLACYYSKDTAAQFHIRMIDNSMHHNIICFSLISWRTME